MATQTKAQKRAKREAALMGHSATELREMLAKLGSATSFSKPALVELLLKKEFDGEELPAARPRSKAA